MHKHRVRMRLWFDLEEGGGSRIRNLKRIGEAKIDLRGWKGDSAREVLYLSQVCLLQQEERNGCTTILTYPDDYIEWMDLTLVYRV